MTRVIVGMTMSLDGFVNDRSGSVAALYPDFAALRESAPLQESIRNTGAVVMGWNTFAMASDPNWYAGNYEYQAPIFVVTHAVPPVRPKESGALRFTFVTEGVAGAIAQAKAAAAGKDITVVGGAQTIRQCLRAGLADELDIDIMPVLLGDGLRLFERMGSDPIRLDRVGVVASPGGRTHLHFRVVK
jgi:dihydrofolate reductase